MPSFNHNNIISISALSKEDIVTIIKIAAKLEREPQVELLKYKLMGSCFFEPSTRTRLSFEAAMHRLGGSVIGFAGDNSTSTTKGESLHDTIKVTGQYVDCIVIRHPSNGSAEEAAQATNVPVINAGDGTNEHPTQTLLDLYAMYRCQGRLDNLKLGLVGDLKNGRTVHSLAKAAALFNMELHFIATPSLAMPESVCSFLREHNITFHVHSAITPEVLREVDILYMTRVQKERFASEEEYLSVKDCFILTADMLTSHAKTSLRVFHPLPRVNEITTDVDNTPFAYYFEQAKGGMYVRMALLALMLAREEALALIE